MNVDKKDNADLTKKTELLIHNDPWMMECLKAVRTLAIADCFIAAGFIRNKIWDYLHGYEQSTPLNDLDVVYFDPNTISEEREVELTSQLERIFPCGKWSVKNQARMHLRNEHSPYANTTDAIAHWVEIPTCVGARLMDSDTIEVTAPLGIENNFSLIVAPNPLSGCPSSVYIERIRKKGWIEVWPRLTIVGI